MTVCIPSYNHVQFLPGAIESVLAQSYANVECLVFDDGSTDGSWDIAHGYAVREERVRVLSHEGRRNSGITDTLNAAYAQARGEYVAGLAADDVLTPDSVERRLSVFRFDPGVGFVYGRIEMLDAEGHPTERYGGVSPEAICRFDDTEDPLQALLLHNYVPGPAVMLRKDLLERMGGYSKDVYYNDWELWIRLLVQGARPAFVDGAALVNCRPGAYGDEADLPRRLDLFRALGVKEASIGGRLREDRIRALVRLQHALEAAQLGYREEAQEAIGRALEVDSNLRDDSDYLFWWLGPLQRRRLPGAGEGQGARWLEMLARRDESVAGLVSAGARAGHFGCWAVEAAATELSEAALETLRWAVVSNELELAGPRLRPRMLGACLARALRRPALLRERWFAKTLLCCAGAWSLAAWIRRGMLTLAVRGSSIRASGR